MHRGCVNHAVPMLPLWNPGQLKQSGECSFPEVDFPPDVIHPCRTITGLRLSGAVQSIRGVLSGVFDE